KNSPYTVKSGVAMLDRPAKPLLLNGNLEKTRKDSEGLEKNVRENLFANFGSQERPGTITFADSKVVHGTAKMSMRIERNEEKAEGNCRLGQVVKLRPWTCYRFSCWIK